MKTNFYPVILAGGRGTRFWPLSRRRRAKQLLALDGKHTMIQQTVARLLPLSSPRRIWVITNGDLKAAIERQLPRLNKKQIVAEPEGRNTAPAIGLAAATCPSRKRISCFAMTSTSQGRDKEFNGTHENAEWS